MKTTLLVLVAENLHGDELQTLICEDEMEGNPEDYFVGNVINAKVAGEIECTGDVEWLGGSYIREN